jgi:hypothetical protein
VVTRSSLGDGWLAGVAGARLVRQSDSRADVEIQDLSEAPAVMLAAARGGGEVLELAVHRPDLADVFFALTGRALRDRGEALA